MKFKLKQQKEINAVKFVYTKTGIEELKEFVGPSYKVRISKDRYPDSKAIANINGVDIYILPGCIIQEGDYLVREEGEGFLVPKGADYFEKLYEPA